jgi:hypothetical protein
VTVDAPASDYPVGMQYRRALVPEDLRNSGDAAIRSLVRACIASGVGTLDRSVNLDQYIRTKWGGDRDVPLLLRAAVAPLTIADTSAFANITKIWGAGLQPRSGRSRARYFH